MIWALFGFACGTEQARPAARQDSTPPPAVSAAAPATAVATQPGTPFGQPPDTNANGYFSVAERRRRARWLDSVFAEAIPPAVSVACDSAAAWVREALHVPLRRQEGRFYDSFQLTERVGCRLTGTGSYKAVADDGPLVAMDVVFQQHHWSSDLRWQADGDGGGTNGRRLRGVLCALRERGPGHDDTDTIPHEPRPEDDVFGAVVECFLDAPRNTQKESDVPDSLWRQASAAGLDSAYAISLSNMTPPYWEADFDGDQVRDVAVLVEHRVTGKIGFVMIHRGTGKVIVLAAGAGGPGPDDLFGLGGIESFTRGTQYNTAITAVPFIRPVGDALWVGGKDLHGFYIWTGSMYFWEPHPEKP